MEQLLLDLCKTKLVSIGPFTSDALKEFNVSNTVSEVHTVPGAFDTIKMMLS